MAVNRSTNISVSGGVNICTKTCINTCANACANICGGTCNKPCKKKCTVISTQSLTNRQSYTPNTEMSVEQLLYCNPPEKDASLHAKLICEKIYDGEIILCTEIGYNKIRTDKEIIKLETLDKFIYRTFLYRSSEGIKTLDNKILTLWKCIHCRKYYLIITETVQVEDIANCVISPKIKPTSLSTSDYVNLAGLSLNYLYYHIPVNLEDEKLIRQLRYDKIQTGELIECIEVGYNQLMISNGSIFTIKTQDSFTDDSSVSSTTNFASFKTRADSNESTNISLWECKSCRRDFIIYS